MALLRPGDVVAFSGGISAAADQIEEIERRIGKPIVEVYFKFASSTDAKGKSVSRSGVEAVEIANEQIELGRDPWFLGRTECRGLTKICKRVVGEIVAGRMTSASGTSGTLEQVGKFFVDLYKRHIEKGRSAGGRRMTPNDPKRRAWKRKAFPGAKVLVQTGMLRDALAYRVKVGGK